MFQPPPKGDNRPVLLMNKPTCSVSPAAQTPKTPAFTEATSAPTPAPVVHQGTYRPGGLIPVNSSKGFIPERCVYSFFFNFNLCFLPVISLVVCSVATTPPPRPPVHLTAQTAVRASAPKPVLTVRPPTASCTTGAPAHPSPNPSTIMPQRVLLSPDMQARLPCECTLTSR